MNDETFIGEPKPLLLAEYVGWLVSGLLVSQLLTPMFDNLLYKSIGQFDLARFSGRHATIHLTILVCLSLHPSAPLRLSLPPSKIFLKYGLLCLLRYEDVKTEILLYHSYIVL